MNMKNIKFRHAICSMSNRPWFTDNYLIPKFVTKTISSSWSRNQDYSQLGEIPFSRILSRISMYGCSICWTEHAYSWNTKTVSFWTEPNGNE